MQEMQHVAVLDFGSQYTQLIVRRVRELGFFAKLYAPEDIAEIAEEAFHHPDIDIRHTKINLSLTTHSQGGLTSMDFELAARIDNLLD